MDNIQLIQEEEYEFPYHYLPKKQKGTLRSFQYWFWGYKYIAGIDYMIRILRELSFESLADVGCGDGRITGELRKSFPAVKITGIDYSARAIALAKIMNPEIPFQQLDITENRVSERYDLVTLIEVLEHIPPPSIQNFLAGVRSMMHENAQILLTVPHKNQRVNPKHYQHFDTGSLTSVLQDHFEIKRFFYFDENSLEMRIWSRVLGNKFFILNHSALLNLFYRRYRAHYLETSEENCLRMGIIGVPK